MRIYFDLVLWQEIGEDEVEKLRDKHIELSQRFKGYGMLSYNMRAQPVAQPQQTEAPQEEFEEEEYEEEQPVQQETPPQTQAAPPGEAIVDE